MNISKRHKTYAIYIIAILLFGVGLFMWVSQDKKTNEAANTSKDAATSNNAIIKQMTDVVDRLEKDHDGQDALLACLFNVLAERQVITKVEVEGCVITTAVPSRTTETTEGTEPANPTGASSQSRGNLRTSDSLANDIPSNQPKQSNTLQGGSNQPPPIPSHTSPSPLLQAPDTSDRLLKRPPPPVSPNPTPPPTLAPPTPSLIEQIIEIIRQVPALGGFLGNSKQ